MQIRNFNSELMFASILFSRLFRNITIIRSQNKENTEVAEIPVNCVIGNRSRIFKNLDGSEDTGLRLPLIVVTRTGMTVNSNRATNLHNEVVRQEVKDRINYNLLTPVPIDIEFTVTLASKWPSDIDMMLSNIIPFFNQDLYVVARHPKYYNVQYFSQVIMGSGISQDSTVDLSPDQDDITTATLTFTFKTYLFGGNDQIELSPHGGFVAPITKISVEVHAANPPKLGVSASTEQWSNQMSTVDVENAPRDWDGYFSSLKDGELKYPDMDTMRWIIGIGEDGGVIVDPNVAYGYKISKGDGMAEVSIRRPLSDMNDETTHDNHDILLNQNKQRMPYHERFIRPFTQQEIDESN